MTSCGACSAFRVSTRREFFARTGPLTALVFVVLSAHPPESRAQSQFDFRNITVADGISHSQVNAIVQDRMGFLWFGTRSGLNRFDGYGFTVMLHTMDDSTSLSGDFILSLLADRKGYVWIGTQGKGLNCYDPITGTNRRYVREFGSVATSVVCLIEEPDGVLLAGTSSGLYSIQRDPTGVHVNLVRDRSISDASDGWNSIRTLFEDSHGTLWIGTELGVKTLTRENRSAGVFTRLSSEGTPSTDLSQGIVNGITGDNHGGIWIGTRRGNVRRLDPSSGMTTVIITSAQVRSMFSDSKGAIWVGTLDKGVYRITLESSGSPAIENFTHNPDDPGSLGSDEVECVYEDTGGKFWIGTNGAGVSILDPIGRRFAHFHHIPKDPSSLGENLVRALSEDVHGNLWIATYGDGLNVLQHGTTRFRHYGIRQSSKREELATSVLARRNGEVWASFAFAGLTRILAGGKKVLRYEHTPGDLHGLIGINVIRTMYEDSRGNVWIGTHGFGLLRYDGALGRFTRYVSERNDRTSISGNHVWSILEDHRGRIWVGTWNRGVCCLDPATGSFEQFVHRPDDSTSIGDYPVLCIMEDRKERIWIGSAGGGLQMLRRDLPNILHLTPANGFPANMVYGILEDRKGNLWLGTNKGLLRYNPDTRETLLFDEHDGIQSREFSQGACCIGKDGVMYFGGIHGFNAFHPDSIVQNPIPPPVVITRFAVFDRDISLPNSITATSAITLMRSQNFFSFEFAALDFTAPAKNRYVYRLEGFDEDWVNAGDRRMASYTNVGPGTYVFRVRGSNSDGIWNNDGAAITVTVLPAVWETWWFRLLALALLAGTLYAIYAYRINKILAIERTRERIARDLHDEVSAILSSIAYFSGAIHQDRENSLTARSSHFMSLINQSSIEVLEHLHDIIWAINPEGDHFENILAKFRRYASDLCESRSIRHDFGFPETFPAHPVETEKRKNLWLLYKEMVTNAVRHSECSELRIRVAVDEEKTLNLQISDDGKGFTPEGQVGHGLRNIRARAASMGARLTLDTAPGKGTRWELRCRIWD